MGSGKGGSGGSGMQSALESQGFDMSWMSKASQAKKSGAVVDNKNVDGESRSYEGGDVTPASIDALSSMGWAAVRGLKYGPVGSIVSGLASGVSNANDVEQANKLGIDLDDLDLGKKHGIISDTGSLLSDDDDNDGGYDSGDDGFGGFGGDSSRW